MNAPGHRKGSGNTVVLDFWSTHRFLFVHFSLLVVLLFQIFTLFWTLNLKHFDTLQDTHWSIVKGSTHTHMHTHTHTIAICTNLIEHRISLFLRFARKPDPHGGEGCQSLTHQLSLLLFTPQVYQWITLQMHTHTHTHTHTLNTVQSYHNCTPLHLD